MNPALGVLSSTKAGDGAHGDKTRGKRLPRPLSFASADPRTQKTSSDTVQMGQAKRKGAGSGHSPPAEEQQHAASCCKEQGQPGDGDGGWAQGCVLTRGSRRVFHHSGVPALHADEHTGGTAAAAPGTGWLRLVQSQDFANAWILPQSLISDIASIALELSEGEAPRCSPPCQRRASSRQAHGAGKRQVLTVQGEVQRFSKEQPETPGKHI